MRYSTRSTTDEYRQLDIRDLERKGLLKPTGWTTLTWRSNGEISGTITIFPRFDGVLLKYNYRHRSEDWQHKEYNVSFDSTPCHYGGERRWFICPASQCSRRVAILYLAGLFVCRDCLHLSYESQREQPYGRALRRAQAIRMKLGGSSSMAEDFPDKPKGMHWRTYSRFIQRYDYAQSLSWPPFLLRSLGVNPGTAVQVEYPE